MKVAGINLNLKEVQLLKWLSRKVLWLRHMPVCFSRRPEPRRPLEIN